MIWNAIFYLVKTKSISLQEYCTAAEQLQNAIHSWELAYRLTTPVTGQLLYAIEKDLERGVLIGSI